MEKLRQLALLTVLSALCGTAAAAQPAPVQPTLMAASFQDHEVLQRGQPIPVWGTATAHARITVTLGDATVKTRAKKDGSWHVKLPAMPAGGPYTLTVESRARDGETARQVNTDVMIGDVFLCSGQSNMEYPLRMAAGYQHHLDEATNKNIRLMHVGRAYKATPQKHFTQQVTWAVTSPQTARDFSAVCYLFGSELQPKINIPVGLIESAWGGSTIQAWLPIPVLHKLGGYEDELTALAAYAKDEDAGKMKWTEAMEKWWKGHDPASQARTPWSDPAYDDASWDSLVPSDYWENLGIKALKDFDGIVWFRQSVTLTAAQAKGPVTLTLGQVDDADLTYVNGKLIGGTDDWDSHRTYTIPAGTLHAGRNLIAVSVIDQGAGGGMWGKPAGRTLKFADGSSLTLADAWKYKISIDNSKLPSIPHAPWLRQIGTADLYNGMIAPLHHTPLKGIVWYQGEQNWYDADEYGLLLKTLAGTWRHQFGKDLPVLAVQLPNYGPRTVEPAPSNWAIIREQMRQTANADPNMHLAVTIDLGQWDEIHPADKFTVGNRLGWLAEQQIYHLPVVGQGPTPAKLTRDGDTIALSYDNLGEGLKVVESNRPVGFQLCAKGDSCRFVDATTDGNAIRIETKAVPDAVKLRFCWGDSPICNVYNSADLPAMPFEEALPAKK